MATENLAPVDHPSPFQGPDENGSFAFPLAEKIRPEYFEEWKERTFGREVFGLFIEYFCIRQRTPFKELIGAIEKNILMRTLGQFNGNQKSSAKFLGMKYTTLNEKIKRYNIHFDKKPV